MPILLGSARHGSDRNGAVQEPASFTAPALPCQVDNTTTSRPDQVKDTKLIHMSSAVIRPLSRDEKWEDSSCSYSRPRACSH
jgi:hypothetical protein